MNVFILTLLIYQAKRFYFTQSYIVVCELTCFTIVLRIISLTARISENG
jgi:integral membrane sensor domain MASE1